MSPSPVLVSLRQQFAIPVLRQKHRTELNEITRALARGGLRIVEITLMSEAAHGAIRDLATESELIIGAGTVRTPLQAQRAIDDGARFIVSPGFSPEVATLCADAEVFHIPGALTPSEVMAASEHGLSLIKIFPAQAMGGASYLKHLSGPFPDLEWMATGGIRFEDFGAYRDAGAAAVGLGSSLLPQGSVENSRWGEIEISARAVADEVRRLQGLKSLS